MINVAIADDHQIVIDGLELILEGYSNEITVVGTTNKGEGLIQILAENRVDVVILDISMPGMENAAVLKLINKKYTHTNVLMLTMYNDANNISTMLRHGAKGYVVKNRGGKEAVTAIKALAKGGTYFSQDVQNVVIQSYLPDSKKEDAFGETNEPVKITPQEAKILELLAEDLSEKQIANELCISTKTVETHKKNLKHKIGAKSEKGLVRFAVENNFIRKSKK